jgi:hypothetical protein
MTQPEGARRWPEPSSRGWTSRFRTEVSTFDYSSVYAAGWERHWSGGVIGAVVAGAAILGAFLDQAFLRKLKRIERDSTYYIAPFLFTAFLGTVAIILLLVLLALTPSGLARLRALLAGATGLSTGWTLGSLIYDLDMLVQFLQLQDAAADVPDSGDEGNVRPMPRAHPDSWPQAHRCSLTVGHVDAATAAAFVSHLATETWKVGMVLRGVLTDNGPEFIGRNFTPAVEEL